MNNKNNLFWHTNDYSNFRNLDDNEKINFIHKYFKNNTTDFKWFISQDNSRESVKPTLLNKLSNEIQNQIKSQLLLIFPEDLITSKRATYERAHEFVISNYFYYSNSFRDFFTAGGKWKLNDVEFPRIIWTIHNLKNNILEILNNPSDDIKNIAYENWKNNNLVLSKKSFLNDYLSIIDFIGKRHFSDLLKKSGIEKLSDIFK
ncbi:hypothetical protein CJJ23_03550 [Mycoplasmopsis agassizii]|uniref:Uncharacterized protein n=1 Tax=Mycoplasmopsis agassizii TaxID=33922 RepID=A0A269TI01_9BACT|nr:hypothetical protein [Mycoplasmopsis agassizii]PAK21113.1 hypothetical protein CJJ23_03550 [Mycoplasmopsis agassizii]